MNEIDNEKKLESLREQYAKEPGNTAVGDQLAQFYADLGWYNESLDLYEKLIAANPDDYSLLLDYGNLLFKREKFDDAIDVFANLTVLKPSRIEGWNNCGIVYSTLQRFEEAKTSFEKVLEYEPNNAGALLNMGNYYFQQKNLDLAADYFNRAIKASPDFADAWFNLANVKREQGEHEQAIQAYTKTLRYQPGMSSALKNLGLVYQDMHDYEKAEELYKKALESNRADAGLYCNLGVLYTLEERYAEAKEHFLRAVKLAPRELSGWMGLRHLSLVKGDIATYVKSTIPILSRLASDAVAQSCATLRELGHVDECDTIINHADAIGKDGDALDAERLLAYVRTDSHKKERTAILARLSAIEPPPLAVCYPLAEYYYSQADHAHALHFVQAIEKRTLLHDRLFWDILISMNELDQAEHEIKMCLASHQDYFFAWFALAKIYARRKDTEKSREALIKALETGFTDMDLIEKDPSLQPIVASLGDKQKNGDLATEK